MAAPTLQGQGTRLPWECLWEDPALTRRSMSLLLRYFLQPRDNGGKSLKPDDLGSLRLNVVYTEDHVFSSEYYSPLRDLLLKSADVEVCVSHVDWWRPTSSPTDLPCVLTHQALPIQSIPLSLRYPVFNTWGHLYRFCCANNT